MKYVWTFPSSQTVRKDDEMIAVDDNDVWHRATCIRSNHCGFSGKPQFKSLLGTDFSLSLKSNEIEFLLIKIWLAAHLFEEGCDEWKLFPWI